MDILFQPETYMSLLTLTLLEIALGIDNIIFISIVTNKLPKEDRKRTRTIGLILALVFRIILLSCIIYIIRLTNPLFSIGSFHSKVEGAEHEEKKGNAASFFYVILQIVALDIIFSFDSILTAIGLSNQLAIMIAAVVISMIVMIYFSGFISNFINRHPTLQVLALSFLILIGFMLTIEAFHYEIPKGYIYFALFFSVMVEVINMKMRARHKHAEEA